MMSSNNNIHKCIHVVLIKPSKYDDEGYVIRYFRGVLPSNTLACLHGLTNAVAESNYLGEDVEIQTHLFDETVAKIPYAKIAKLHNGKDSLAVVGLVGVQTNQFVRASDLALRFRKMGIPVMIGGFHVSGQIALFKTPTPELQALLDAGVTLVAGEVEDTWKDILKDFSEGHLKPLYNYLEHKPDLSYQPIPVVEPEYLKHFAFSNFGTIDCGRGCPFACSFCTIINVQGRHMRNRQPDCILSAMKENYKKRAVNYYFFTDDNFSRNHHWEEFFDALIEMKEKEGIEIFFMMQVDVLSYKIPNFVEKAEKAGCTQVFIGMESLNPKNLQAAGKKQNKAQDYAHMIEAWHTAGIGTHVGYIIGFPFDSPESVKEDIDNLKNVVKVDQASFFMLTPLPGSMDHYKMVQEGVWMDEDYNRFDSFHPTTHHPNFTPESWMKAYKDAWASFYGTENMKSILSRADENSYWRIFMNFIWYKSSIEAEGEHPMIAGFLRMKDRKDRRPGFAIESPLKHAWKRTKDLALLLKNYWHLFLEMEEVWLATRIRSEREKRLVEEWIVLRNRIPQTQAHLKQQAQELLRQADELKKRRTEDVKRQAEQLIHQAEELKKQALSWKNHCHMSWHKRLFKRLNIFAFKGINTRAHIDRYWFQTKVYLKKGKFYKINLFRVIGNFLQDIKLNTIFLYYLLVKKSQHTTKFGDL
jgi:radical SAM superfamily enzyme YgiQ (UPF0313 family)